MKKTINKRYNTENSDSTKTRLSEEYQLFFQGI